MLEKGISTSITTLKNTEDQLFLHNSAIIFSTLDVGSSFSTQNLRINDAIDNDWIYQFDMLLS